MQALHHQPAERQTQSGALINGFRRVEIVEDVFHLGAGDARPGVHEYQPVGVHAPAAADMDHALAGRQRRYPVFSKVRLHFYGVVCRP